MSEMVSTTHLQSNFKIGVEMENQEKERILTSEKKRLEEEIKRYREQINQQVLRTNSLKMIIKGSIVVKETNVDAILAMMESITISIKDLVGNIKRDEACLELADFLLDNSRE